MNTTSTGIPSETPLVLEMVSDTICPWCYVAKRRLERALILPGVPPMRIVWKPFELNPEMPVGGMDRREYRSRKFGSWERSLALDAKVALAGAELGIAFRFEKIERTPNTLASHKLLWLAGQHGRQNAVAGALFEAYFGQGQDIVFRFEILTGSHAPFPAFGAVSNGSQFVGEDAGKAEQDAE